MTKNETILIVGDSPDAPTGFGVHGAGVAWCLARDFDVHYLGFQSIKEEKLKIRKCGIEREITVHPNLPRDPKPDDFAEKSLPVLMDRLQPDVLITLNDIQMVKHIPQMLCPVEARIRIADLPLKRQLTMEAIRMQIERAILLWREKYPRKTKWLMYAPQDGEPPMHDWIKIYMTADKIVAMSKYGKYVFERYYGLDVPYIYHGVDTELFKPREKPPDLQDYFVVGDIQRNQPRKQPIRLIEAFAKFAKDKDDVLLYMQMNWRDPYGWPLEYYVRLYNIVEKIVTPKPFGIPYENIPECYAAMDVNVNPTAGEGFGLTALEGFAMMKPYIATDYTTSRELIIEEYPSPRGTLVPYIDLHWELPTIAAPKRALVDVSKLAETLEFYYKHPEKVCEHGENGRKWVQRYAWNKIQRCWCEEVNDLLNET